MRPAPDTIFSLLDGRPTVFSPTTQKIYEFNAIGAYIWCQLVEQRSINQICSGLRECGVSSETASQLVGQALDQWFDLELLDLGSEWPTKAAFQGSLLDYAITVAVSNEHLTRLIAPLLCHSNSAAGKRAMLLEAVEFKDQVLVRADDNNTLFRCHIEELVPKIKAYLTERILHDQQDAILHAASLVAQNGKGMLICGAPGAGKSTLALHLYNGRFKYGGDDVALVAPDGRCRGLAFAPTLKRGAWDLIPAFRKSVDLAPTHRRADEAIVKYLPLEEVYQGPFETNWIVFINRSAGASTKLFRLGEIETMQRLINGAYSSDGRLTQSAFGSLKKMIATAQSLELTYSSAAEATIVLEGLCYGLS